MKTFSEWIKDDKSTILADGDIVLQVAGKEATSDADNVTGEHTEKLKVNTTLDTVISPANIVADDFKLPDDSVAKELNAPFVPKDTTIANDDKVNDINNFM